MGDKSNLNTPGFSGDQNSCKVETETKSCICCLAVNVPLVSLTNCKHVEFFECNFEFKFEYSACFVCHACHFTLLDIYQFKRQVAKSLFNLNRQITKQEQNSIKVSKLARTDIEIFHIQNSDPLETQIIKTEIKTELIKIEEQEHSDLENDVPLSEIKIKNPNTPFFVHKHKEKIKLVTLSEAELREERKKEASKAKYLKLLFKCESCIVGFDHEQSLKEHMEKRHTETDEGFTCGICKSVLVSDASYKEHLRRHYRRIDCGVCGARYSTVMSAQAHYDKAHAATPTQYTCEKECGYTTSSYRSLRYHRDSHKDKVICDQCEKTFVNTSGLKVHMYTVHQASNRVYSCAECPKTYRQRSGLLSHVESAHGARAGAYCAPCRTHFRTQHGLKHHLNTHRKHISETDKKLRVGSRGGAVPHARNLKHHLNTHTKHISEADKKCVCGVCDARFMTKGQLREHVEWEHLKITKHKCDDCNKYFRNNAKLQRHINYVHEKKRPPRNKMCDHCGRGFTTMAILRSHIRTHTGERPHACKHCPATFAHSAALYTHNKLLHTKKR